MTFFQKLPRNRPDGGFFDMGTIAFVSGDHKTLNLRRFGTFTAGRHVASHKLADPGPRPMPRSHAKSLVTKPCSESARSCALSPAPDQSRQH